MQLLVLATGDSGMVSIRLGRVCRRPTADFLKDAFISLFLRNNVTQRGYRRNWEKGVFGAHQGYRLPFLSFAPSPERPLPAPGWFCLSQEAGCCLHVGVEPSPTSNLSVFSFSVLTGLTFVSVSSTSALGVADGRESVQWNRGRR